MHAEEAGSGPAATELSSRVGVILDAVEGEALRMREETRAEAERHLAEARREADALLAERQRLIAELSDEIVAQSEAVLARLEHAVPVRQGFENLVRALGDASERLAREVEAEIAAGPAPFAGVAANG